MTKLIPREYQLAVDNAIWDYFRTHKEGNPIVGMPTGTGKAFQIAYFMQKALASYPRQKFLVATHVKELVHQNYLEFLGIWPEAPAGIYSAGLRRRDTKQQIVFCGIASIVKNIEAFGKVDLLIVDECHLISANDDSMYMRVIAALKERNPYLRVIGFTATPWREGQGRLTEGNGIFTDMAIDLTDMVSFNRFVKEGYLVPLVSKPTKLLLDVNGVGKVGGEFNASQLELAVNKDHITFAALQETLQYAADKRSWIVFASGLEHAEKIRQMLEYLGVSCRVVHSKMKSSERDQNIADWKAYKFTAIINMGILTTGVNHPGLDLIVMLRPTMSSKLWVQMLGRGTRPLFVKEGYDLSTIEGRLASIQASVKQVCLVMDFAGNIKRCGPINDPMIPRPKGGKAGEAPIKICDACGNYNHISARFCGGEPYKTNEGCGAEFSFQIKIKQEASTDQIVKDEMPVIETWQVQQLHCSVHRKQGKPDSVRATYYCMNKRVDHYLLIEHGGFMRRKAESWWARRSKRPMPDTAEELVEAIEGFEPPTHIKVWTNTAYKTLMDECFMGEFANVISAEDDDIPF
jgi:DNA repair protein RadD